MGCARRILSPSDDDDVQAWGHRNSETKVSKTILLLETDNYTYRENLSLCFSLRM